jgi:ribokinase
MGRVFIAGSINMDVVATADRHPRVGETVAGKAVLYFPGGKGANQAVAAAKLGAPTTLIGRLGADAFGQKLRAFLSAQGVDLTFVTDTEGLTPERRSSRLPMLTTLLSSCPAPMRLSVLKMSPRLFWQTAMSRSASSRFRCPPSSHSSNGPATGSRSEPGAATQFGPDLLDLVDILILNETELGFLTGSELTEATTLPHLIETARSLAGDGKIVCVTQGKRGLLAVSRAAGGHSRPHEVKAVDTTGAGDCFVGALPAACRQQTLSLKRSNTPARSLDLRATDGRGAVDADSREISAVLSTRRPGGRRTYIHRIEFVTSWRYSVLFHGAQHGVWVPAFAGGRHRVQPSALFRSKLASAACSGVIEPLAASSRRPNMWSPARLMDSMPTSFSAL